MKKKIVLTLVLVIFPINIIYSLEDLKLKLPQGSTGEIYRAKAGHNFYTVVKVGGREKVMFANQYSIERWSRPAGAISTIDGLKQIVEGGSVQKLRKKSGDKVPDEVDVKVDGTVEVVSWQEP
jgi:hypothetical protein